MLVGEPGVGKTAIAEGLARRIEFEPESVPVRLRDCQVINLQMNAIVAGTMLRGMFEDRIQNVIREIKERPNLILFVDEAHTMVGAGSALGSALRCGERLQVGPGARRSSHDRRDHAERVQGDIQEDEALARRFRMRARGGAHARRDAAHPLQPPPATRAQLLGRVSWTKRSRRRSKCRPVINATSTFPTRPSGGSTRLRYVRRSIGDGRSRGRRRRGDLPRGTDSRGHGLSRRRRSLQAIRRAPGQARHRSAKGRCRAGAAPGAEQGSAQGRLRPPRWRAAVPRAHRRRKNRAREGRGRVPVRRREEDDSHRHVRVPGRRRVGGQADWHAARHRRAASEGAS